MIKHDTKLRALFIILSITAVLTPALGGHQYYSDLRNTSLASEHAKAAVRIKELRSDIDDYLSWHLLSVKSMAGLKEMEQSLLSGGNDALSQTHVVLDHYCDAIQASVCYLIDRSGNTIASSNRDDTDSFVGKNYAFRPYFKQALKGSPAVYMALGVTSNMRGVYYSHPVYGKGNKRPLGVAVIKSSVEAIEKQMMRPPDGIVLLTDPHGVVFVSSRADWLYHVLWKTSPETISDISKTRQFGNGPWQWSGVKRVGESSAEDTVRNKKYHVHQEALSTYPEWHLIYLHSQSEVAEKAIAPLRKAVGVGGLLCVLLGIFVSFLYIKANTNIVQRKKAEEEKRRLHAEMQAELHRKIEEKARELKESQGQLFQAAKLVSLGEMSAGMAHEMNQPLAGIALVAKHLRKLREKGRLFDEAFDSEIGRIESMVKRMVKVIQHIRAFARQDTLQFSEVSVNETIHAAMDLFGEQLHLHSIKVDLHLGVDLPPVIGEPYQLEQVWVNLLSNARDALDDKGNKIEDGRLSITGYEKILSVKTVYDADLDIIRVGFSDNGSGISKDIRDKIFEPFFTSKEVGKGTGLGLSISYGIITQHDGTITVDSNEGEGTRFTIELPVKQINSDLAGPMCT